jgi:hypothetical protein
MENFIFKVVAGSGGFKIVDDEALIYGSFSTEDEATLIAARLNKKVMGGAQIVAHPAAMPALGNLIFTRKAVSWGVVNAVPADLVANIELPTADILGSQPCADFTAPAPAQFFIARNTWGTFLINTEGYTYARYALRLAVAS